MAFVRYIDGFGGQGGHAPKTPEVALCPVELLLFYSCK